uniref:Class II aldolase/adducin N-terminal domain-containing protein n=1 Tax=Phlebotomus papatasi TaxID=29031 RepID=A0A1B0D9Q9_PHLPP
MLIIYESEALSSLQTSGPPKSSALSPPSQSDSEPQVLRIETKQAPKPSQPEVVLSDVTKTHFNTIKDNRRADIISAGPQSHILEGVSWDEANRIKDATVSGTSDQVVLMGAASKGIIQRGYQHNATVYKAPYAKNPFDSVTDDELSEYRKTVERKAHGDLGIGRFSNTFLIDSESRKAIYEASRRPPEGLEAKQVQQNNKESDKEKQPQAKWRVGGAEFEAAMRMMDNAGFRTGYIYRNPLVKSELPKPKNDVELPPAVSSLGYLLEEEELYRQGVWKKSDLRKGGDRSRWLNSPNVYQKVEVLETGTPDPKKITKLFFFPVYAFSEFVLHSVIHAARPDIRCAIFLCCNPVVSVSALKTGLLPLIRSSVVLGEVAVHSYTGSLNEPEEREKLIRSLGPISKVLLLTNHGAKPEISIK